MKKILIFIANLLLCIGVADAAIRDGTSISRNATNAKSTTQSRISTTVPRTSARTGILTPRTTSTNNTRATQNIKSRSAAQQSVSPRSNNTRTQITATTRGGAQINISRAGTANATAISSTRTGAEYEQCKSTYFSCMDQFCTFKNDDYRRCSCNDRVFELAELRDTLQSANDQLTEFTENLDVVGMTAAQATAMRTESDGEAALTSDGSASKALLQAIMNSIRGDNATVGGKYTDLNSINLSFDTVNAFGMTDIGQAIATYNGQALYNAVYPQCRDAVRADCNDASLQRAITAYLMAIEQDCNTVQTAIENTQSKMKSAVRESSALLDLARIENRKKHNSSDIPTCINEIETAILSEQVCGANYHKCLDNGEYVDITTGKPIVGVKDFFKLGEILKFSDGIEAAYQKLAQNPDNKLFVQNFESRVKKFAADALDKCVENADIAWSTYLDKAMLDIYYAQQSKISEVKQTCFDYISTCYGNTEAAIDAAMSTLNDDSSLVLQPDKIALGHQVCSDYIQSCNNMFGNDNSIIEDYIAEIEKNDTVTACRAIAQQCFDKYGGTNYENFYYPYSGAFEKGNALDWFTLYEYDEAGNILQNNTTGKPEYKSECAKQLADIDSCSEPEIIEQAFGGLDKFAKVLRHSPDSSYPLYCVKDPNDTNESVTAYGIEHPGNIQELQEFEKSCQKTDTDEKARYIKYGDTRPSGAATATYNNIISILQTQCININGSFVSPAYMYPAMYDLNDPCLLPQMETSSCTESTGNHIMSVGASGIMSQKDIHWLVGLYGLKTSENICPRNYKQNVDTKSWGVCSCWANGARRSQDGTATQCLTQIFDSQKWADATNLSGKNQVCPNDYTASDFCIKHTKADNENMCTCMTGEWIDTEAKCTNAGGAWTETGCDKNCTITLDYLPYGND